MWWLYHFSSSFPSFFFFFSCTVSWFLAAAITCRWWLGLSSPFPFFSFFVSAVLMVMARHCAGLSGSFFLFPLFFFSFFSGTFSSVPSHGFPWFSGFFPPPPFFFLLSFGQLWFVLLLWCIIFLCVAVFFLFFPLLSWSQWFPQDDLKALCKWTLFFPSLFFFS